MPPRGALTRIQFLRLAAAVTIFVAFYGTSPLRAAAPSGVLAAERAYVFEWFSALGYPDVKSLPFVSVVTHHYREGSDRPQRDDVEVGFLVADSKTGFTLFTFGRETRTFPKSVNGTSGPNQFVYKIEDLAECARFVLDAQRRDTYHRADGGYSPRFGVPTDSWADIFTLSWVCWRKVDNALANELFDRVKKLYAGDGETGTLKEKLSSEISRREIIDTWFALGDTKLSRPEVLARYKKSAKNFPNSPDTPRVLKIARVLEQMVAEDTRHAEQRAHGKPFDKLSKREQIAELIFQLRDQSGVQLSSPGCCDIFDDWMGFDHQGHEVVTPANRLVEYGYDAVPQLIDALDDTRPSRAMGENHLSPYVLTVGDCAEQTLSRIAGFPLYAGALNPGCMSDEVQTAAVKAAAKAWHATLLAKGEKQMLVDAAERADDVDAQAIEKLIQKYPDAALPAIKVALGKTEDEVAREILVQRAGMLTGEAAAKFLWAELRHGKSHAERLAAAQALCGPKHKGHLAAIVNEWDKDAGHDWHADFVDVLINSGCAEAIRAFCDGLEKRPVRVRVAIIGAIYESDEIDSLFGLDHGKWPALQKLVQ